MKKQRRQPNENGEDVDNREGDWICLMLLTVGLRSAVVQPGKLVESFHNGSTSFFQSMVCYCRVPGGFETNE